MLGFATHMKEGPEIVIISSLENAEVKFIELEKFFEKSPAGVVRFELVTPS